MLPVQIYHFNRLRNEARRRQILRDNIERRMLRNANEPFASSDTMFINTYRLTKDMVQYLIAQLAPHMSHSARPNAVAADKKILTALHFFASGSYQICAGQNYMLSV